MLHRNNIETNRESDEPKYLILPILHPGDKEEKKRYLRKIKAI